jgi:hypothetical protein
LRGSTARVGKGKQASLCIEAAKPLRDILDGCTFLRLLSDAREA